MRMKRKPPLLAFKERAIDPLAREVYVSLLQDGTVATPEEVLDVWLLYQSVRTFREYGPDHPEAKRFMEWKAKGDRTPEPLRRALSYKGKARAPVLRMSGRNSKRATLL